MNLLARVIIRYSGRMGNAGELLDLENPVRPKRFTARHLFISRPSGNLSFRWTV